MTLTPIAEHPPPLQRKLHSHSALQICFLAPNSSLLAAANRSAEVFDVWKLKGGRWHAARLRVTSFAVERMDPQGVPCCLTLCCPVNLSLSFGT